MEVIKKAVWDATASFLYVDEALDHVGHGFELSFWTLVLTLILELWSIDTVKRVLQQRGGEGIRLYCFAVLANLRNHFLFGSPVYVVAVSKYCRENQDLNNYDRAVCVATILFVHSIFFYLVHRAFHTHPSLYVFHRFHHKFNVHVPPMAANAVSPVEYIVAYILPFTVAMPFLKPDPISMRVCVSIVSVTNLMIHTPKLVELSEAVLPLWLVSTGDHLEHHRKLTTKYAAPTFNIDYFVAVLAESLNVHINRGDGGDDVPSWVAKEEKLA